jgi:hypothetical protein
MVEEKGKFNTPSLKRVLRGWVCYKVVSEKSYNTRPGWAIDQSWDWYIKARIGCWKKFLCIKIFLLSAQVL